MEEKRVILDAKGVKKYFPITSSFLKRHVGDVYAVDDVDVVYDEDGSAILPTALAALVHDGADRKMVAAALASRQVFGEGCIVFAGDTDWHDWEDGLLAHELLLEPIIEAWSRAKHAEKLER